jgi:OmpA-OmpF porin, OOP family
VTKVARYLFLLLVLPLCFAPRAAAVVQVLVTKYGVAAARLQAYGDGPHAPVTSNDAEDGRALNRRVELVKQ